MQPTMLANASYRRAAAGDYARILELQSANFVANLTEAQRQQGFLSAQFSAEQTARIAEDLGITVALVDGRIAGFLCAFRKEFPTGSPVIAEMLSSYEMLRFEDLPLSSFNSYIYGPVCIAREYRGRGLLRGLYEAQRSDLAGKFDLGVAFVSRNNPHSLSAHTKGLAMSEAGDFTALGKVYAALAFRLPQK